jgi:CRP-like cAMP-binding protein
VTLIIPARLKRTGKEMKIIVENGSDTATPDASLVRVLVRAHVIRDRLLQDKSRPLDEIAKSEGMVASYPRRLFRLTLLAPDIVSAILCGKHPPELKARKLMARLERAATTSRVRVSAGKTKIRAPDSISAQSFLSFGFTSLTSKSVTTSETPAPPDSCGETAADLRRAYPD